MGIPGINAESSGVGDDGLSGVGPEFLPAFTNETWLMLGIAIQAIASLFGALGKVLFKLSHSQHAEEKKEMLETETLGLEADHDDDFSRRKKLCLTSWSTFTIGCFLVPLGAIIDLASFYMAPQRILAPLVGLCIFWNILLAKWILDEQPLMADYLSCFFIFVGSGLTAVSARKHKHNTYEYEELLALFTSEAFLAYSACVVFLLAGCAALAHVPWSAVQRRFYGPLILGIGAGIVGGQLCFTKAASVLFHPSTSTPWGIGHGDDELFEIGPYLICLSAVASAGGGLLLLNAALRHYSALMVIPIFCATVVTFGTGSAAAFFTAEDDLDTEMMTTWIGGSALIVAGVLILACKRAELEETPASPLGSLLTGPTSIIAEKTEKIPLIAHGIKPHAHTSISREHSSLVENFGTDWMNPYRASREWLDHVGLLAYKPEGHLISSFAGEEKLPPLFAGTSAASPARNHCAQPHNAM